MIWVLWLLALFIYHYLTVFTSNNEALSIYDDALNVEAFSWAFTKEHLVITRAFEKHDFSLVGAHNQTTIWHPCMAGEIIRDVSLFL